ncbi:MAG: DUF2087 domain-containing protein [Desulfovibrionaceae bacterium]
MSRTHLPLHTADLAVFARSLRVQLAGRGQVPSHLELMNMLARSAGYRNFQHLRAEAMALGPDAQAPAPEADAPVSAPAVPSAEDMARARRVARHFDAQGRLMRWPGKQSQRVPCLWALWAAMPPRESLTEPQVNALLEAGHSFGDAALLRRWLCDMHLMTRTRDGREYRRVERQPPPDALELMRLLAAR